MRQRDRGRGWKSQGIREARKRGGGGGKRGSGMGEAAKGDRPELRMEKLKGAHGEPHKEVMGRETLRDGGRDAGRETGRRKS